MNKQKHLTLKDRQDIEEGLNEGKSFKTIGILVNKDCTTISKEVRKNFTIVKPTSFNSNTNCCKYKKVCSETAEKVYINKCKDFQ